jgi:hypothetical protein
MDLSKLTPWQRIAFLNPCVEAEDCHHARFYRRVDGEQPCSVGYTLNVGLE